MRIVYPTNIFITGANGYIGSKLLKAISSKRSDYGKIIAFDLRDLPETDKLADIDYRIGDIRDAPFEEWFSQENITPYGGAACIYCACGRDGRKCCGGG